MACIYTHTHTHSRIQQFAYFWWERKNTRHPTTLTLVSMRRKSDRNNNMGYCFTILLVRHLYTCIISTSRPCSFQPFHSLQPVPNFHMSTCMFNIRITIIICTTQQFYVHGSSNKYKIDLLFSNNMMSEAV